MEVGDRGVHAWSGRTARYAGASWTPVCPPAITPCDCGATRTRVKPRRCAPPRSGFGLDPRASRSEFGNCVMAGMMLDAVDAIEAPRCVDSLDGGVAPDRIQQRQNSRRTCVLITVGPVAGQPRGFGRELGWGWVWTPAVLG